MPLPHADRRPSRRADVLAQLIALLKPYGGSLWSAKAPVIGTVNSDGSGGSLINDGTVRNVGQWLDLVGSRHALQANSAAKPQHRLVPTKFGPELVVNGGFSAGTVGWVPAGGTVISGGVNSGTWAAYSATTQQNDQLSSGKSYIVGFEIVSYTSGAIRTNFFGGTQTNGTLRSAIGKYEEKITISAGNNVLALQAGVSGFVGSIDNVSLREVQEEQPALVFDGVDDGLLTAALPSVAAETFIVAAENSASASSMYLAGRRNTATGGSAIYVAQTTGVVSSISSTGLLATTSATTADFVASAVLSGTSMDLRLNGGAKVSTAIPAYSSGTTALAIGRAVDAARFFNKGIFAVAYAPVAVPDDDLARIERLLSQHFNLGVV